MTPHNDLRILYRYLGQLTGAGRWLLGAWLLGILTLVGSLGLLGLSGWFLSAAAVAGLTPASALAFNFFVPGAGVRFFAILWGCRCSLFCLCSLRFSLASHRVAVRGSVTPELYRGFPRFYSISISPRLFTRTRSIAFSSSMCNSSDSWMGASLS